MRKNKDFDYFASFVEYADFACKAAASLQTTCREFDPEGFTARWDELHAYEHAADELGHRTMARPP